MTKKIIRLTEEDLHRIVKESVDAVMANLNRLNNKPQQPIEKKEEVPENYIYSVKELQWMYDNQDKLSEFEREVLDAAMWVRARMANYNGYSKEWYNIYVKNGELYYNHKGLWKKIPR